MVMGDVQTMDTVPPQVGTAIIVSHIVDRRRYNSYHCFGTNSAQTIVQLLHVLWVRMLD